ncbi:sodium-translocating pyrophosphatase [Candidatus Gottesmanbacteria bacterium]|nr:sodium-translocating pyrophosphatase [Candidatus Gottesmanbacteria bacterium]
MINNYLLFSLVTAVAGIIYALFLISKILKLPTGNKQMNEIAAAISEGAKAYLNRQYKTVFVIALVIFVVLFFLTGFISSLAFAIGASLSAAAGYIGMNISVKTNVRTSQAATHKLPQALKTAFAGGSVTGLIVASLALIAVTSVLFLSLIGNNLFTFNTLNLVTLGFGASLISVFARLGGGIYTKGADVGTDMVGKIEKGIPEDDPRNPGVIADLVGDNVGDCAGMAADLFETYVVSAVAAILLGSLAFPGETAVFVYPILIGGVAIIASIIGTFFVKLGKDQGIMKALYKGLIASSILSAIAFYVLTNTLFVGSTYVDPLKLFIASLVGIVTTFGMVFITEFYTSKSFSAVKNLAKASETGHGTNIIAGLANSMKATAAPIALISIAILVSYWAGGIYAVSVAAMSMLSLAGIVVSIDAFGPITDNAGGIAEMTNMNSDVRKVTDALDSVGNTTKAVTKAYAIASAGLAALVLFASYTEELTKRGANIQFNIDNPYVLVGLFIGAALPYMFAALAMEAVGKAGMAIVSEIRRQFKEIKGIMTGRAKPEYGKAVDIVTKAALREMIIPALLPIIVPILVGYFLGPASLGGLLVGTIITGLFVGVSMTTGGAAWDNAKKYIEEGNFGGKGSFAHQAAVTGDTVGDPYKDTAGPAINPMIKVANIAALLIAPFII